MWNFKMSWGTRAHIWQTDLLADLSELIAITVQPSRDVGDVVMLINSRIAHNETDDLHGTL